MIIEEIGKQKTINGVIHLTEPDKSFEDLYLQILKREKRLYSDDEVKLLPYASKQNPHKDEWALRTKSFLRFKDYLSKKKSTLNILDLGCGNGWLTAQLAKEFDHNYFCIDTNLVELEQAARVFSKDNISFFYTDITKASFPSNTFHIIIINSYLQYFPEVENLLKECFTISKSYGEVHIIDTPFYKENEIMQARNFSLKHFTSLGLPEMTKKYYHHTIKELKYFRFRYLYNPDLLKNKLTNFIFEKDSPYPWIMITR